MAKTKENNPKSPRTRSPNFPVVSLKKAVEWIGQLYDEYQKHDIPINLVHSAWGYKEHGSAGNRCIAAVKAFGLVDVTGSGKTSKVKVTEDGHRIYEKAPDASKLLKKAALLPPIHDELWKRYRIQGGHPQ